MDNQTRERQWGNGFHTGSSGKTQSLEELPVPYLQNIVNKYGADHDVSAVQAEIDKRPKENENGY